jgi:hypothetical protein
VYIERLLEHDAALQEHVMRAFFVEEQYLPYVGLLSAAAQLARDIVARLLLAALQRGSFEFVERMLAIVWFLPHDDLDPTATQLARDLVAPLLLAALQNGSFEFVERMLANQRRALDSMTSDQVEGFLLAAVQHDSQQRMQGIGNARLLSEVDEKQACLEAAKGMRSCVRGLCRLPAAAEISSTAVSKLLWAAVQLQGWGCTWAVIALCKLPAAADISPQETALLLDKLHSLRSIGAASGKAIGSLHKAQKLAIGTRAPAT